MSLKDDSMLIEATLGGQKEAFETLVERHHRRIFNLASLLVRDFNVAEDMAQETFLRAYRSLERCDHPDRFDAWLSEITRNCVREWSRTKGRAHASLDDLPDEQTEWRVREELEDREARLSLLEHGVAKLPDDMRRIVIMKYKENMTCAEIARALGKETNTVAKILSRAYEKLQQELKRNEL